MKVINFGILFLVIQYIYSYTYAYAISSKELLENAKRYDGEIIYFEGEVIGEVMRRGAVTWLNLSDGECAIGVVTQTVQLPKITYYGSYKAIGDRLGVEGIFHRACSEHGGELDIHATSIKIVEPGHLVKHPINLGKVRIALILLLIVLILISIHSFKTRIRKVNYIR